MSGSVDSHAPGRFTVRHGYVFAGDIIAIPPFGAAFSTGISIAAHPELNVPMTATTASFAAYALAFCEHLPESHFAAWAVASSHDWKAML